MPYTTNSKGHGPSWANSLFEDNAEYGLGMYLGVKQSRERVAEMVKAVLAAEIPADLKAAMQDWLDNMDVSEGTRERAEALTAVWKNIRTNAINAQLCIKKNNSLSNAVIGSLAATAGLMTSVTAVWIMFWLRVKTLTLWFLIPKFIQIPVVNRPKPHRLQLLPNLLPAAKRPRKKIWA